MLPRPQVATSPSTALQLYREDAAEQGAPRPRFTRIAELAAHWARVASSGGVGGAAAAAVADGGSGAGATPTPTSTTSPTATTPPPASPTGVVLASAAAKAQYGGAYPVTIGRQFGFLLSRQTKLLTRNKALIMGKVQPAWLMAVIIGSVFLRPDQSLFVLRVSLALFACIFLGYSNIAEIPVTFTSRNVVNRHIAARMFSPWAYVPSVMAVQAPLAITADVIFATILYWMSNYVGSGSRYVFFVFVCITMDLCMNGLFRLYAYITPSQEFAGVLAGAGTGLMLIYGGFLIPYSKLPPHAYPFYWFSPFSWSTRSLALNEFFDSDYAGPVFPGGPSRGSYYAGVFGLQYEEAYRIAGPFVLIAYWIIFGFVCCSLVLSRAAYPAPAGTTRISESTLEKAALEASSGYVRGENNGGGTTPSVSSPAASPAASAVAAPLSGDKGGSDGSGSSIVVTAEAAAAVISPSAVVSVDAAAPVRPAPPLAPVAVAPPSPSATTAAAAAPVLTRISPTAVVAAHVSKHHAALVLPRVPVTLAYQDITYEVYNPRIKKTVTLLRGIDGYARPGTMTALMGASGAGAWHIAARASCRGRRRAGALAQPRVELLRAAAHQCCCMWR